ncbi:MAG: thiamine pyrophosphate-dependent enzyme [Hyphomicrobiaceae bacterium]
MADALKRRPLVGDVLAARNGALIVPGLGSPTWDCFAAEDSPETLSSWGGMGLAVPTALGIAIAQPDRRVLCITGDGEMMMGIGALAVVAAQKPKNLGILVLDNEHFGETGRQRGLTSGATDLAAIATGAGIAATQTVRTEAEAAGLTAFLFETPGPVLAVAKIAVSDEPWALPEKDGATVARRFRDSLGIPASSS